MQKYVQKFRLVWALLFGLLVTFLFLDFTEKFSPEVYQALLSVQVVPALVRTGLIIFKGLSLTAWGLLSVLILTLLFGRVYCSFLCPLGILQDVTGSLAKRFRGKIGRLRFALPRNVLRYSILALVVVSLFFGGTLLLAQTDPYSIFGRVVSDLLRPLYLYANNALASLLLAMGSYALYPVNIIRTDALTLVVPLLVLALVVWMSVTRGRLYCNTVCPVGTLLGLISKVSLFRPAFEKSSCNRCGDCVFACKAQCIDLKTQTVDASRCVGCFNCVSVCSKDSMKYRFHGFSPAGRKAEATGSATPDQDVSNGKGVSRRLFFAETTAFVAVAAGSVSLLKAQGPSATEAALSVAGDGLDVRFPDDEVYSLRKVPVSPPGSVSLQHFTSACTACHLCVSACPTGVLQPSFLGYGLLGMNMPEMDYEASFCNEYCTLCSEVCPNGAILKINEEEKKTIQLGQVYFDKPHCIVVTDGTSCGSCAEHCPTKAVRMVPYQGELTIPFTDPSICIGCGACEYACPVPEKAIYVLSNKVHLAAALPVQEEADHHELEDFPF